MKEEEIIRELKKGNNEIFQLIVEEYKNRVFSCAYKFTRNYTEAQDLSQEIFLKIYSNIQNFNFKSKLSTWVYRVATNHCIDWKRKNKKIITVKFDEEIDPSKDNNSFTPEKKMIKKEKKKSISDCLQKMPKIYKECIIMYHFNDMSYKEISKLLKVPEKTIETRLYRGRRLLKKHLKESLNGGALDEL